jgi:general secretion pathway protein H
MPTSTAAPSSDGRASGFTLLELAIVLFVLAITASFLIPRLRDVGTERLRASARRLATTTRYVYEEAAFRQRPMRLNLDLDTDTYWVSILDQASDELQFIVDQDPLGQPVALPAGVAFEDVILPALGTVQVGLVFAQFYPEGYADPLIVHLHDRHGTQSTLAIEPLTGRTRVADGYIDPAPLLAATETAREPRR